MTECPYLSVLNSKIELVKTFQTGCIPQTVKHPTSNMAWTLSQYMVQEDYILWKIYIMKQDQYYKVSETRLIPQVCDWYPNGEFILMHDGAPDI